MENLLTKKEIKIILRIGSESTFRRLEKAKKLPPALLLGGQRRYRQDDVAEWLKSQKTISI